jgi:hypothetical protein
MGQSNEFFTNKKNFFFDFIEHLTEINDLFLNFYAETSNF